MKKLSFWFITKRKQLSIGKLALIAIAILLTANRMSAQDADIIPPAINDFSLSSAVIDTTNEMQNVTVNVQATDNDKGVNLIAVRFRSPSGNQFVSAFINSQQRISGDNKSGFYSAVVTFPQYSKAGMWSVLEVEARDEANNYKTLNNTEIASLGYASELQVICGNEDLIAPEISNLSFDSSVVDTTNGSQSVNVTVRVTDAVSGVGNLNVYFYLASNDYLITAELKNQQRISGDEKDGIYTGTVTFPQGIDGGMWRVAVSVSDSIGNQKTFDTDELAALGCATELQVIGKTSSPKSRKRQRFF